MRQTQRITVNAVTAVLLASSMACTGRPAVLLEGVQARALAAELHVAFAKATEASGRAVMADTDEASVAGAHEAEEATAAAQKSAEALTHVLADLKFDAEARHLDQFVTRFAEYRTLDAEILPLAVENTNLKAQRLSFTDGQQAVDELTEALDALRARAPVPPESKALAADCRIALLRIQVLQARHIAEPGDDAMTAIERQMATEESSAREKVTTLASLAPEASQPDVAKARAALERFIAVNREVIRLSRRNSNVRSLALSLGRKRVVTAECEDQLNAIDSGLNDREFRAVR